MWSCKIPSSGIDCSDGCHAAWSTPGCGETLLAKAVANESGADFINLKGPKLLDKHAGESQCAVHDMFERAASSSPCAAFFDEVDSLCPEHGSDGVSGEEGVSKQAVNQLLTEMEGMGSHQSVFVIAAANRPKLIDPAVMQPGCLDKLLCTPLLQPDDHASVLMAMSGKIKSGPDAEGCSGADCTAFSQEAGSVANDAICVEEGPSKA